MDGSLRTAKVKATGSSRGWSKGVIYPEPATFGGPTMGQKYKVRQNVIF